ncbi:class I adenylate-forming enzyme family protein [Cumulibacter soli]|uniref:class I adenylate-forming enzyme family protein n=1 Tax=Cumulibacter soli TaxID=2546344 RepID=UPI001419CEAA|nr:AMP-binding protein [Cumulibacter soli]
MSIYREQLTIGDIPHRHAEKHHLRDKPAVIEGEKRITWAALSERSARVAGMLRGLGIERGDKVSVILQNRAEFPELIYGVAALGAAIVPISYRFVAREIVYAIEHSDSSIVIVDADVLDTLEEALKDLPIGADRVLVIGEAVRAHPYGDYEVSLAEAPAVQDGLTAEEMDIYHLAFTGGTTGYPKACEVPQRMARQNWYDITVETGIREDDVMLISGAFYHGLGFMWGLQQLMVGGTVVMQRTFDPQEALQLIERERVSVTPAAPTLYTMMLSVPDRQDYDVRSMRVLVSAGAPLLTVTKEGLLDYFTSAGLYEYYGATEAGFYSILKPIDQRRKTRSVGQAWFGCELRILDAEGVELPPNEVGMIFKRGLALGVRYYKNPAATAEAFRGEWVTSGDLGYLDDEGYLYVVDRAKDMIISGGVNIFPTEIEEVISAHPAVVECAVVGVADEKWGEVVCAYVVSGAQQPLEAELDELCISNLARYKRPRIYRMVDALPKNASGKILKRGLRAAGAAGSS